ncbi:transcriptional regulator TbsP domain-containing protein [Halobaculum magnesiiphilum]|uniref:DUF5821 family protein n=1 Tax=Halobaculum magnesiiphilum TaxID=1017351 RepID=A0A8T8WF65_9EURY|nr:DUF5821 family protein [Halobaculum magnesiiphilum]QZP38532.1 DUF5821 family protein [Halobaculum magnesiiphilum]
MTTGSPSALADRALTPAADALVVDSSPTFVRGVVDAVADDVRPDADASPSTSSEQRVRLLCTEESADAAFADFLTVTAAVDAGSTGRLAVRTVPTLDASLTIADGTVRAHVSVDGEATVCAGDDETLCAVAEDAYDERWRDADPYAFDVPGRTTLVESFADRWPDGAETLADLLGAADTLPRTGAFDPVTACTLVGARHELLTMHIGEWAEEIGLSSRTEIARSKSRLVETGLVETEREPVGVGRPRHRLVLAGDGNPEPTGAELLALGRSALCE